MSDNSSNDDSVPQDPRRRIPQVERLLHLPQIEEVLREGSRAEAVDALRALLADMRRCAMAGVLGAEDLKKLLSPEEIAKALRRDLGRRRLSPYRRVINATGIILHTGLGRAVLSPSAVEALTQAVSGYSLVEVDLETGERSQRELAMVEILRELTGAEDATIVNNNAAATLLILAGLARGKEVIISRGQLVEIGGSFRIPEILKESGARLVEVGTTNRTYIDDYRRALGPDTGLLLQVHTSNYEIQGFVHQAPLEELVALGRQHDVPVVSDLGSGCFVDLSPYGFRPEPLAASKVAAGADLVCFSGDKLLGGPQAGVIIGRTSFVKVLRAHPLYRTLRLDKTRLVLLEATLRAYRDPETLARALPPLRAIMEPPESVRGRALECVKSAAERCTGLEAEVVPSSAQAGSGSLPAQEIPSFAIALKVAGLSPDEVARRLRRHEPPIFSRVHEGKVLLDFRTVLPGEETWLVEAISSLARGDL